ncbi:hypothetical protein PVBG_05403 [Plasmodium vivax Brazil I]|nr:hypothetical protein PVBG_05403 [Plasmodium vivax Brazil I]
MLMKDYNNSGNTAINSWCNYRELIRNASFPPGVNFPNFEKVVSHEPSSVNCPLPSVQTQCNCTPCEMPGISPQIDLTPQTDQTTQTDRTKNLAVTSGFTAVGTLGTLFFLYRFTPMMSWFRRPGMNNVGTDLYMNPGGAESFLSMQKDNGSNNLFYHP